MLKKDLILKNPLRLMGGETKAILSPGGFGAVLARSGVGKTAFLVQVALNSLLSEKNVLHVSLEDPVAKVDLWYSEVFRLMGEQYQVTALNRIWESVLPHRFIMTFNVDKFSLPKLAERLEDLTHQNIFLPDLLIIDGFPFSSATVADLEEMKAYTTAHSLPVWFTLRTHRHEKTAPNGFPEALSHLENLFDVAVQLQPEGKKIHIRSIKMESPGDAAPALFLDPSTMLVTE